MKTFLPLIFLTGCSASRIFKSESGSLPASISEVQTSEPLTVLSVTGGLCLVAGMILLVVTSGRKGWYPVIGGIALVILNYLVAKYDDFIFYPLVVCTAMISTAWTYKTVRQILLEKSK